MSQSAQKKECFCILLSSLPMLYGKTMIKKFRCSVCGYTTKAMHLRKSARSAGRPAIVFGRWNRQRSRFAAGKKCANP